MDSPPPQRHPPRADGAGRSLGELFRELRDEGTLLVRQELALARAEVARAGSRAALDTAWITIWAAVAGVGGLAVVAGIVVLVGQLIGSYWLGALIVSVVLIAGGGGAALYYLKRLRSLQLAPKGSIRSVQATGQWARAEVAQVKSVLSGDGAVAPTNRIAGHWSPPQNAQPTSDGRGQNGSKSEKEEKKDEDKGAREKKKDRASENPGVWGLMKTTGKEVLSDDVPGQAAKVAYYAFLSLPPAIMVVFALAGFFGGTALADWIRTQASLVLPSSAAGLIESFIQDTVLHKAPGPFSIGIILALWGGSGVFMGLGGALDIAYDLDKKRSWFKRRAIAIGVMIVAVALFLVAGGALLVGPSLAHAIGLFGAAELAWQILKWPVAFLFMVAAFWFIYYVLPNKDQSEEKGTLLKAAAVAALLWVGATALFRLYVANFSSYSQTYGILGTIIVLLLYFYVSGIVVLAGGELAAEMEVRS